MTATDCLDLRSRLAEHALSTLPEAERGDIERHLAWCAGCRKEARELQEGAAIAGLSLPPVEPPVALEDRVVSIVQRAATRGRPSRRRVYAVRTITVLAAVVGLLAVAVAGALLAQRQTADKRAESARQQAVVYRQRFAKLLRDLQRTGGAPGHLDQVVLRPADGSNAVGGAIVETSTSSRFPGEIAVLVAGLDGSGAPYRVWLAGRGVKPFMVPAFMPLDNVGGGQVLWSGPHLLAYHTVQVRDAWGHVVLAGTFHQRAP